MVKLLILLLSFTPAQLSTTSQGIERAFLQNHPKMLYKFFPKKEHINISLPEPISFSDQISNQQAYFLFKKIFSSYSTFEFYSKRPTFLDEDNDFIFRARWSFRDNKNNNQYVYHVFFYLKKTNSDKNSSENIAWKITEIKAEKN